MKFKRTILSVSVAAAMVTLSACGGGGGGGGGTQTYINNQVPVQPTPTPTPSPTYLRTEVPFATPTLVATVDPLANTVDNGYKWAVADTFTANISGTNSSDIIIAGRMTQPTPSGEWGNFKLSILSWQNGTLVDRTSQWFPNDTNIILGSEPSVKTADFFKTGRNDLFLSTGTDMQHYGPTYFYRNTGTSFERQILTSANIWSHDSAIGDLNGDGYTDIAIIDYGPNATLAFNNKINGFNVYTQNQSNVQLHTGSSVAIGDFLQNGSGQLIVTDTPGPVGSNPTKMYTWSIDANNKLNFTEYSTLPTPRFELPKWAGYGFVPGSHNVRVITYDFNDDLVPDVLIFSRPALGTVNNKYSEIQFLRNNGLGNFSDVTDTVLVGYNTNTYVTYNPRFIDINGDGREDILVSSADFTGANNSTQILLKSNDGKYVAAYQNIFTDFLTQANAIKLTENIGNTVNIFKAPDGKLYLLSAVSFMNGNDRQLAVYMSEMGTQTTVTAQNALQLMQQKWPYMSAVTANTSLALTSATYFGGKVIDLDALLNPIGDLYLGSLQLRGYVNGVKLGSEFTHLTATDTLGRDFTVNVQSLSTNSLNMWSRNTEFIDQHQITSHSEYLINSNTYTAPYGMRVGQDPKNFTIGSPSYAINNRWSVNAQYTSLSFNPWIQIGGAFGTVNGSTITELVSTYRNDNFVGQFGFIHATTNINPGLVTKVNDINGVWAEGGYQWRDHRGYGLGVYAGVKPIMLSGGVEAKLPTSIDSRGNINYTNVSMNIQNPVNTYVRVLYTGEINRQASYILGGTIIDNGMYRAQAVLRLHF